VGELTLACQPVTGLGRPGRSWPPRGPPWAGGNQARTRPGQRAGSAGRTPGSSLTRGGPDARPAHRTRVVGRGRKGIEQCRRASPLAEELVAQASWNSFASAAGPGHASRWRMRPSKSQQGATQLGSQRGTVRPVSKGPDSAPLREAHRREATRKRRAIRSPVMPRKQKLRGLPVTAGARLERHR
jgi:hypothetical protein